MAHKRKRGVILSIQGWQRLQAAEYLAAARYNSGRAFTLEQLSDRTQLSTKTLTKVRHRQKPVDQPTLVDYFRAFDLTLTPNDYLSQELAHEQSEALLDSLLQAPLKGQLALDSPLYVYRPPAEQLLTREILQPGALIRIRAPRQFGKTSLVAKGLARAKENQLRAVVVSLQLVERSTLISLDRFLQWLCATVANRLGLPHQIEELWQPIFGSSYSCNEYFENYLLPAEDTPLLIILDEVNILFNYPDIATDFFGLLRAWYERSRHQTQGSVVYQKLRLIISYSTDVFLPLNIHQSPFNVGLLIELEPFTLSQVQELALRYGLTPTEFQAEDLRQLLGGNPFLTQLALFHLSQDRLTLAEICKNLTSANNIFASHLRQQLVYIEQAPHLKKAIKQIMQSTEKVVLYPIDAYKLQGLGLIRFEDSIPIPSCQLYQLYFSQVL
ncbi:MAG: AAA-like domain-containing protein [Jaaginema sp. PMC 1078.18]|nr:AAA-like domain-containing protein [Jaaginema sp. PMC 1078.18]